MENNKTYIKNAGLRNHQFCSVSDIVGAFRFTSQGNLSEFKKNLRKYKLRVNVATVISFTGMEY